MLPPDIWQPWEPRVIFPVFGDCENTFDFAVQPNLFPRNFRSFVKPFYYFLTKKKPFARMAADYKHFLSREKIRFRSAFLDRDGNLIKRWDLPGTYGVGQSISVNLNRLMNEAGLSLIDGEFLLVASRGRPDLWSSSPGNVTARYVGSSYIAGYRTGFFARALNSNAKGHFGFTGINPKILLNNELEPSLMLLNHSSEPSYERSVEPKVRLFRNTDEFLEADFGPIPPFGIRERSLRSLFPQADEFLAPVGGRGFTITQAKGVTLASIHLMRGKSGKTLGMEHSRPAHGNVIKYSRMKGYAKK